MTAKIKKIDYCLPGKILDNEELVKEFTDWDAAKIEKKIGIKARHVVAKNETATDLALKACEKVLQDYDKTAIDFLIFCTQSPDYFLPSSACILQNKLGLNTDIGAFDINLGCSGFVYGLSIAKGVISAGIAQSVLLVVAETYSKYIHPLDKSNRTIFGDGAAAAIIEKSDEIGILNFVLGTDGSGFENLIVKNGGHRNKYNPSAIESTDDQGNVRTDNHLFMDGTEIFNFTINAVPKAFNAILKKNNIGLDEIDHVIFHQANKFMLDYLRKIIKIPKDKFYMGMLETGNTVSATIPIAIKDCINNKIISQGDKVLILGFGVGYSWAGTIIEI
jgi:3-oxoacyl-[acyl-carrier-protein] synthase-3